MPAPSRYNAPITTFAMGMIEFVNADTMDAQFSHQMKLVNDAIYPVPSGYDTAGGL